MTSQKMRSWRTAIIVVMFFFSIASVLAWSNTTFNNSLTSEILFFTGNQNITRWLEVPSTVGLLRDGYFNLTGFILEDVNTTGLVSYWSFDGTLNDSIDGAYNFTDSGGVYVSGKENNQVNFTTPSYAYLTRNYSVSGNMQRTISFWGTRNSNLPASSIFYFIAMGNGVGGTFNIGTLQDDWYFQGGGAPSFQFGTPDNSTHMHTVTHNGTGITWYIDGDPNFNFSLPSALNTEVINISLAFSLQENLYRSNVSIDELAIWNRSLTPNEIRILYNGGVGRFYPFGSEGGGNETTLFIGDTLTNLSVASNGSIPTTVFINGLASVINSYLTAAYLVGNNYLVPFVFHSDNSGNLTYSSMLFHNDGFTENSQTFNATAYETSIENFLINITYDSTFYSSATASLVYDGTSYAGTRAGTGNNISFSRNLNIETVGANKSVYWAVNLDGTLYNSTFSNQTVNMIQFGYCNASITIPFVNFTFQDEQTGLSENATTDLATWSYYLDVASLNKSFIYTNTVENTNYTYCFDPPDRTLSYSVLYQYASAGYPQRRFSSSGTLTNSTTQQLLYLLATADGIYSAVQTAEAAGTTISGVTIVVERQFSGVWTIVEQGVTGSDGLVTFWLNPNYDHRLTATKTGYASATVTIRPSQSTYTLIMGKSAGAATYNGSLKGMSWTVTPAAGNICEVACGSVAFGFNLTANLANLDGSFCQFELVNSDTDAVLNSTTGGDSSGCNLSVTYTPTNNLKLKGKLYIDTTDTSGFVLIDADAYWITLETDVRGWGTLTSFFEDLKDLPEFGDGLRQEYSRVVFFFFMLVVIVGILTYTTGYDFANPGFIIIVLFPIFLLASYAGWFEFSGLTPYAWLDQYAVALVIGMLAGGWWLNYFSRNS